MAIKKGTPVDGVCPFTNDQLHAESKYFTADDATSRLQGTYIRYKDKAILVKSVSHRIMGFSYCSRNGGVGTVHTDSVHIDASSPPLGFLNEGSRSFYVRRLPKRRWKSGIDHASVYVQNLHSHETVPFNHFNIVSIGEMIEGIYPTVKKIMSEIFSGDRYEGAFHRRFCIGSANRKEKTALLYYKTDICGYIKITDIGYEVKMIENFYHSSYIEILTNAGFTVR